jgi:hypothetical protein
MDLTTREICGDAPELIQPLPDETDLPPEYCRYKDEGCEYARACLECPFPQCLYDEARGRQRWLKELRDQEILRLFTAGRKVKELAALFDISERTVQRAIKSSVT